MCLFFFLTGVTVIAYLFTFACQKQ